MKKQTFTIEKDFGDKELKNVFVKDCAESGNPQKDSLQETLALAKDFVCVVAENAFSNELINALVDARKEGIRIYALVKELKESVFEPLKNNCIIRAVPHINGNYLICDRTVAFFFDAGLQGYALKNTETVGKLHDTFIYEFWNNAESEFVVEKKKVSERTFDVSPVQGNDKMIINRSALLEKPYDNLLQKATDFVIAGHETISDVIKLSDAQHVYLDKKCCEKNREYLSGEKELKGEVIYSDNCRIPLCKSNGKWYISNNSFNKSSDNDSKLFLAEMENEPEFSNAYHLKHTYTYREAVKKEMLSLSDFSPVKISDTDEEQKSFACDYKEFKRIKKMTDSKREEEFNNRHLLFSDKLSANVTFSIDMSVRVLTKGASPAPIYESYKKFREQIAKECNAKSKLIEDCNRSISKCESDIKEVDTKISELEKKVSECKEKQKRQNDNNAKIAELTEKIKKGDKSAESQQYEKQLNELKKQNNLLAKDIGNLQKYTNEIKVCNKNLEKTRNFLDAEKKKKQDAEECLSKIDALEKEPKTVADCEKISSHLENLKTFIPPFDKPCFGTLYKVKDGYEYEVYSDEDYDKAEEEMQKENVIKAGVKNIKFVTKE